MSVRDYLATFSDAVTAFSGPDLTLIVQGLIGWALFDLSNRSVNVVNISLLPQFEQLLDTAKSLIRNRQLHTLVFASAKPRTFIVGADITALYPTTDAQLAQQGSHTVQLILNRLESLPIPTIAAINGPALGAGLELALACDYRVCSDGKAVQLGLPEVKLGLLPGSGGTVRLTELIGVRDALAVILEGGSVKADKARRLGLVDAVLEETDRVEAEHRFYSSVRSFASRHLGSKRRRPASRLTTGSLQSRLLDGTAVGRWAVGEMAARQLDKKTRGHYPAPYYALDSVLYSAGGASRQRSLERESDYFGRLSATPQSKSLISLFFMLDAAKKNPTHSPPRVVQRVAVIGGGVMGQQIAQLLLLRRLSVYVRDINQAAVDRAVEAIGSALRERVKRKRMKDDDCTATLARLTAGVNLDALTQCELVIEAAVEVMELKVKVVKECERYMKPDAIFATNTSSLSITTLAAASSRPEQVVGIHFFNPVARMPLVELITTSSTSATTLSTAYQFTLAINKVPVQCRDSPGFIVNRLLAIYMAEAGRMVLEDGLSVQQVDAAMLAFGMPMGPFRLMDEVGLDVAKHVGAVMASEVGVRFKAADEFVDVLERHDKWLGKKSGVGFYLYNDDGKEVGLNMKMVDEMDKAVKERRAKQAANDTTTTNTSTGTKTVTVSSAPARPSAPSSTSSTLSTAPTSSASASTASATASLIVDRLLLLMLNESCHLLSAHVVPSPASIDLALILGTGFPPYTGGLLHWADGVGVAVCLQRLRVLRKRYGERYRECGELVRRAEAGERFFPDRPDARRLKAISELPRSRL